MGRHARTDPENPAGRESRAPTSTGQLAALTVGFVAVAVGISVAHGHPEPGYEIDIYRSTPAGYWVGIAVGGLIAVVVGTTGRASRRAVDAAGLLGSVAVLSIVALPLLRSYHYYGAGDSLTHLGWAREMDVGSITPDAILYPALHTFSIVLSNLTGLELVQTLQLLPMVVYPTVFVLGSVLCVTALTDSTNAPIVAVVSALCFVPINKVSVHIIAHPSSQAILLLPFVLYLLIRHLRDDRVGFPLTTPIGAAFATSYIGLVVLHPQESMLLLSMLVAMSALQSLARRYRPEGTIATKRSLYAHTILLGAVFALWTVRYERARSRAAYLVESLILQSHEQLSETATRESSLGALGGSFEELLVKLFAVSLLFCLLAGGVFVATALRAVDGSGGERTAILSYLAVGLVPASVGFLFVFAADQGDHYFRFLGTIMVTVTLVGTIGLVDVVDRTKQLVQDSSVVVTRSHVRAALVITLVVLVSAQAIVIHQSPYMYKSSQQVTAAEMDGYDVALTYHDGETPLLGFRSGSRRYIDAHHGSHTARSGLDFPGYRDGIPGEVFSESPTTHYDSDRYLVLLEGYKRIEVELYQEIRYTREGFRIVETAPEANRIQDNGELELYRITPAAG
ncbi:hypothetical protein [Halorubrum sp. DTA98]|uniref:hypothetical protein n=1 Tax=Halorubrum sp. DTA98 TaxID=3402163 RepID=UPI003AAD471B